MFVPELRCNSWDTWVRFAKKCKIVVYDWDWHVYLGPSLELQAFDGEIVYSISQPVWRKRERLVLGKPLDYSEIVKKKTVMKYDDWEVYKNKWLEKKLKEALEEIKKMFPNIVEGKFRSIVFVREEED
ncbi:MAG: hypothetical protein DRI01_09410 [Chloroflexi bacterium]|nr:MAG: hypothetical protein DRI01_09410 [Chloroflexota bacterium]